MRTRLLAAATLVVVALAPVGMSAEAAPEEAPQVSGYNLRGRGSGVLVSYDIPGRLPISPVADFATPDVQASVTAGPTPAASSSLAYPGPLILSLATIFGQFAPFEYPLPPYPVIVRAPTAEGTSVEDTSTVPGGRMDASAEGAHAKAAAVMPGRSTEGAASTRSVEAETETVVDGPLATTRVRVVAQGIELLGGVVTIDGLVTDLVVSSDGVEATAEGGTTLSGVEAFGLPAVIDGSGIRFADRNDSPPTTRPGPDLLSPLKPVLEPTGQISDQVAAVLQGDPTGLQELFEESGISIRVADPVADVEGPAGSIRSSGLQVQLSSELDATPIGELLDMIPPLPEFPGSPFQAADLVAIIGANQVSGISFGAATASAAARPLTERSVPAAPGSTSGPASPPAVAGGGAGVASPSSPLPGATPASPAPGGSFEQVPAGRQLPLADLVGWRMVALALAAAIVGSFGTRKLPDLALAPGAGRACDLHPSSGGRPT